VRRFFSAFPDRAPGIGLLILRGALIAALIMGIPDSSMTAPPSLALISPLLMALSMALGFLTPILSLLYCSWASARLFGAGSPNTAMMVMSILNAAALALLGPGAYSLDARLFGRRVIVFPPAEKPHYR